MLNYYDDSNRKAFALITSSEWNRIDSVGGGGLVLTLERKPEKVKWAALSSYC